MADNNRNQRGRTSNQQWNENSGRQDSNWNDQNNYGSQENRDFGYSGSGSRYGRESNEGYFGGDHNQDQSYNSGRYDRENSGRYSNQDRNYGYGGREYGSSYGGGLYQGNSSYYGSGSYGSGSGNSSYDENRNLYDRDYEGVNRGNRDSRSSRLGGSNYSGYSDRGRGGYNEGRTYGSSGSGFGNREFGRNRYGEGDPNERSWWDRTRDEVSSWFGDDDAERRRERDKIYDHKGKGPRNYKRSDERIKEDINDRLSDDPFVDASEIDVTVNEGEVTLTGTVNERSDKRRAEDIAEAVSGVKNVENRLRVGQRSESLTDRSNPGLGTSVGTGSTSAYETGVTGSGISNAGKSSGKGNLVSS
jgi:osmotically-inducible protein OsmY